MEIVKEEEIIVVCPTCRGTGQEPYEHFETFYAPEYPMMIELDNPYTRGRAMPPMIPHTVLCRDMIECRTCKGTKRLKRVSTYSLLEEVNAKVKDTR